MKKHKLLAFLLLLLGTSCRDPRAMPQRSMWQGTLELPDGVSVPFRMNLDFSSEKPFGYFLVGDEQTPIPELSRKGDSLTFRFSEYSAEIRVDWDGMQLAGNYLRIRPEGTKSLSFTAAPERVAPQPDSGATTTSLPDGNYQVFFQSEKVVDDSTVAKFWTKDGLLYGTFIAPDGDYGLLVGKPLGKGIQLSRFTGWQAIAITLEFDGGVWSGRYYAASEPKPRPFVLQPRADADVEVPAAKRTAMKNPKAEFAFSGLSLTGDTVRHTDERFKGKALILDIMGTWCHNCLDEAPVLEAIQKKFGKDGLEVVGLSFEITDDQVQGKKNLQLFKDRFGLTYTLLFCGSLDDANVKKQIQRQLDNFFAYPTAIFIDKNHTVQAIHSGFKGPGTAEEFQRQIREFEDLAAKIVN